MDESLTQFILTAFVTLFVVINPLAVAPVFVSVTKGMSLKEQKTVLNKSTFLAFCIALFFMLVGRTFLAYLGVSIYSFMISGGILLFMIAFPMLFGQPKSTRETENLPDKPKEDVSIFPMAMPMLAGPGTISTVLMLSSQTAGKLAFLISLIVVTLTVYLISWPVLFMSRKVMVKIGEDKVSVITRILGMILAALAIQFILNGITSYYETLAALK